MKSSRCARLDALCELPQQFSYPHGRGSGVTMDCFVEPAATPGNFVRISVNDRDDAVVATAENGKLTRFSGGIRH